MSAAMKDELPNRGDPMAGAAVWRGWNLETEDPFCHA